MSFRCPQIGMHGTVTNGSSSDQTSPGVGSKHVHVLEKVHGFFCCAAWITNHRLNERMEGQGSWVTHQGSRLALGPGLISGALVGHTAGDECCWGLGLQTAHLLFLQISHLEALEKHQG